MPDRAKPLKIKAGFSQTLQVETYPLSRRVLESDTLGSIRMFLRYNRPKKDGKEHRYWSVVENRRLRHLHRRWFLSSAMDEFDGHKDCQQVLERA